MKIKIFFTLLLTIAILVCNAQTKQETINWLNEKLSANQTLCDCTIGNCYRTLRINNDGSFVVTERTFIGRDEWYSTFEGNFKDFIISSIKSTLIRKEKSSFAEGNYNILLISTKGRKIKQTNYEKNQKPSTNNISGIYFNDACAMAFVPIPDNNNLDNRYKKAFKHLIVLCGGEKNKEAF